MLHKNTMPREEGMDNTLSLLREGYLYISNRCNSFQSNFFETRLFGKNAICMSGAEAAELFYDPDKFKRKGAAPKWIVQSFFGDNSVQTLDENVHQHRKEMLMSVMNPNKIQQLITLIKLHWEKAIIKWEQMEQIIFYEEVQQILCRAACEWVAVPLKEAEVVKRTKELASLFESASSFGPTYLAGRRSRNKLNEWIEENINEIQMGKMNVDTSSILYTFATFYDLNGDLLKKETAAVEVLNLLRPIVAISIYVNFLLLSIHHYPEEKEKLFSSDDHYVNMFVQEVRRYYPFFPFIAALVKKDFTWKNLQFKEGSLSLLDIYGTNHDPNLWDNPNLFNPSRFKNRRGSSFDFIPQGGGDFWLGHRCAGEWATIEMMKVSLKFLVNHMSFEVPKQDLSFSMVSMPSIPHSKIIIKNVTFKH